VQGLGREWYFDLNYLTDSLGYTRFKSNQTAGPKVHTASATVEIKDTWKIADTVPAGSGVPATSIPAGSINQRWRAFTIILLLAFSLNLHMMLTLVVQSQS
ncbi:hypothetical protein Tco_0310841, partial [Tanacetum coccineum]